MASAEAATAALRDLTAMVPATTSPLVPDSVRMHPVRRGGARRTDQAALERMEDDRLALAVARMGAGAFEILYHRFQRPIYGYCYALVGSREEAEDAFQDAMMRAYQALLDHRAELRVKPWLYSIARNACIDRIRQRRRFVEEEPAEELLDTTPSAQESLERREELRTLLADMGELSERQRSALLMREVSGLSHEEISEVLETTPNKSKSLISEARQALSDRALGREMPCDELRDAVQENGRRVLHGRRLKAHVDCCSTCSEFLAAAKRRPVSALIPFLPAVQVRGLLARVLESGAGTEAAGGGFLAGASLLGAKKLLATAAVMVAGGAGAATVADRAGQPAPNPEPSRTAPAERRATPAQPAGAKRADDPSRTPGGAAAPANRTEEPPPTGRTPAAGAPSPRSTRPAAKAPQSPGGAPAPAPLEQATQPVRRAAGEVERTVNDTVEAVRRAAPAVDDTLDTAETTVSATLSNLAP